MNRGTAVLAPSASRFVVKIAVVVLFVAVALAKAGGAAIVEDYRNENYGYVVTLPDGVSIERAEPPAPNHGFSVSLGSGAYAWVDASFSEAAATLKEAIGERGDVLERCGKPAQKTTRLGGLRAVELAYKCTGRASADAASIMIKVLTIRERIIYTIGVEHPVDNSASEAVFRQLISGLRFTRRK